jgi:AraC-like DNA-binding protein
VSTRFSSIVPLFDARTPRRIISLGHVRNGPTAQALDWPGVLFEAGRNEIAQVDDLSLAHHYLGLNTDRRPITLEVKEPHGFKRVTLAPGTGWLVPAGDSFSLRVRRGKTHAYARLSFDPLRFDQLAGAGATTTTPVALRRTYGIGGSQVRHLIKALAAEASDGTPSGLAFVEAITAALALQLVQQAGAPVRGRERIRGGLAPTVRRRVLEMMDARPDGHLTIDALAREAGLSPAHFARAFKTSTGRAPHQHLVVLRLERARRLLDAPGAALSDVALATGFADQAHFTRFFKRQYGVTPGALVRSRSGERLTGT